MKSIVFLFRTILLLLFIASAANAERGIKVADKSDGNRAALIIGNSDYQNAPLRNPVNDARGVAKALRECGFDVTLKINASQREMEKAIRSFGKKLRRGGAGLFYYAGHGIQINGRNFLIPIGATIESESDVKYDAVDAGLVLGKMEDAGNDVNIVILDACRNNPFARSFRSAEQGLARMDAPKGSIVAYATAPGSVAKDGEEGNGIYTKYLIRNIRKPGLTIEQVMKRVRAAVVNETSSKQVPWESSSLMGNFYFSGGGPVNVKSPSYNPVIKIDAEEEMWLLIKSSERIKDIELFLSQYPYGRFSAHAQLLLTRLESKQKAETAQETKHSSSDYEVLNIRCFEGGKTAPKASERIYKESFDKEITRYVYTELKVNNFQYKADTHEHDVIWLYYNPDGSLRGRIQGNFIVKPEWATSWIYRGWGWSDPGNWPAGIYRVELSIDGVKLSAKKFTIK